MSKANLPDRDTAIERLASAVANRIAASTGTARIAGQPAAAPEPTSLVQKLASAVGQRLAARSGTDIDRLASAVAHRLSASPAAAQLVGSAGQHYAGTPYASPELDRIASAVAFDLRSGD